MLQLQWMRCAGGVWCGFNTVDLSAPCFRDSVGVYVIWHSAAVVRVGQGHIAERLAKHRNDPEITRYSSLGLFVTWAEVHPVVLNGVERFLFDTMNPLVGERCPDCESVAVNLPA